MKVAVRASCSAVSSSGDADDGSVGRSSAKPSAYGIAVPQSVATPHARNVVPASSTTTFVGDESVTLS